MESQEAKRIIEAALFMSSRPLSPSELGKLIGVAAPGFVSQKVREVQDAYNSAGSAIEIVDEDGKFYMRVRQQYVPYVKSFASAAEISPHALKTLAYIAKNEGITKRQLFNKLGSRIYSDVGELIEKGFVSAKKAGRTHALYTTPKFKSYFEQSV